MEGEIKITEITVSSNQKIKHSEVVNISPPVKTRGDQHKSKVYLQDQTRIVF